MRVAAAAWEGFSKPNLLWIKLKHTRSAKRWAPYCNPHGNPHGLELIDVRLEVSISIFHRRRTAYRLVHGPIRGLARLGAVARQAAPATNQVTRLGKVRAIVTMRPGAPLSLSPGFLAHPCSAFLRARSPPRRAVCRHKAPVRCRRRTRSGAQEHRVEARGSIASDFLIKSTLQPNVLVR